MMKSIFCFKVLILIKIVVVVKYFNGTKDLNEKLKYEVLTRDFNLISHLSVALYLFLIHIVTWLILPVVIRLSQRLSHACVSINNSIL